MKLHEKSMFSFICMIVQLLYRNLCFSFSLGPELYFLYILVLCCYSFSFFSLDLVQLLTLFSC